MPWLSRGMEGLWLLTVFLILLMVFCQNFVLSEAKIAYVEVPKVAPLCSLAALMVYLGLVEWAIKSRPATEVQSDFGSVAADFVTKLNPLIFFSSLKG